jgi:hypothetical protein
MSNNLQNETERLIRRYYKPVEGCLKAVYMPSGIELRIVNPRVKLPGYRLKFFRLGSKLGHFFIFS